MPLAPRLIISNKEPVEAVFSTVIAGTGLEFPLYFEDETSPGSGVWNPVDFTTGGTFVSEIRYSPFDLAAIATLTVTPRGAPNIGWVDFFLEASKTLLIGNADVHWSCKWIPTSAEHAREISFGKIPVRWGATR